MNLYESYNIAKQALELQINKQETFLDRLLEERSARYELRESIIASCCRHLEARGLKVEHFLPRQQGAVLRNEQGTASYRLFVARSLQHANQIAKRLNEQKPASEHAIEQEELYVYNFIFYDCTTEIEFEKPKVDVDSVMLAFLRLREAIVDVVPSYGLEYRRLRLIQIQQKELEVYLRIIAYLKSVIHRLGFIKLLDSFVSTLHRVFFIPHSPPHEPPNKDKASRSILTPFQRNLPGMVCFLSHQ